MANLAAATRVNGLRGRGLSSDELILRLQDPRYKEESLAILSQRTQTDATLPEKLWQSGNTIYILLQEVLEAYRKIDEPMKFNMADSVRVCNAISLFQNAAFHPRTRMRLIKANIPFYLYPFLKLKYTARPYEYLRLVSLGVLGALVKGDDPYTSPQIVHFFLGGEVFPLCLCCIEVGGEMSKTVGTFIISKMLMQEEGLCYCCEFAERFYCVTDLLKNMVDKIGQNSSPRLLKSIINCYYRFSCDERACKALCDRFPEKLRCPEFTSVIKGYPTIAKNLEKLLENLAKAQDLLRQEVDEEK